MSALLQFVPSRDGSARAQLVPSQVEASTGGLTLINASGSNWHPTLSNVVGGDTSTPTVNITVRVADSTDTDWQTFRFALGGCTGKTITVNVSLANKGGESFRSAWAGPFVNSALTWNGWTAVARSWTGGVLTFTLDGSVGDTLYVSAMPPNVPPVALDWLNWLATTYPTYVHDDVPARVTLGAGPYICGMMAATVDELGRAVPSQPVYGVRIGDDSVGTAKAKPRLVLAAGVHSGEEHGPIELRACVQEWLTSSTFATMRQQWELWVYPCLAASGGHAGYQRRNPFGTSGADSDLNRGWTQSTTSPAMLLLRDIIGGEHHGVNSHCRGSLDFHDTSPGSQPAFGYYRSPIRSAVTAAVTANVTGITLVDSSANPDSTTKYFRDRLGIDTSFTSEASDESGALSVYQAIGAQWAHVLKAWADGGLFAPRLSNLVVDRAGATADFDMTTDGGSGTIYAVLTTSATAPTRAQVQAGQDHTGAAATWADSEAVSASGLQVLSASGLAVDALWLHAVHVNSTGTVSQVVSAQAALAVSCLVLDAGALVRKVPAGGDRQLYLMTDGTLTAATSAPVGGKRLDLSGGEFVTLS